jgi:hypothetical protein
MDFQEQLTPLAVSSSVGGAIHASVFMFNG